MKYSKFDVSYKLAAIEEYHELSATEHVSIRDFARSKGISHSTFYQWLKISKQEAVKQDDPDTQSVSLSLSEEETGLTSAFIRISDDIVSPSPDPLVSKQCGESPSGYLKLRYRDMVIEFPLKDLPYVLRSMRQW